MNGFLYSEVRAWKGENFNHKLFFFRLTLLIFYALRAIRMLIVRKSLPLVNPFDPLLTMVNLLRFGDVFILTFTLIAIFFVLAYVFEYLSSRDSYFRQLIYEEVVWMTDQYNSQPDTLKPLKKRQFQSESLRKYFLLRVAKKLNLSLFSDHKLVNLALNTRVNSKFFPKLSPHSKYYTMFMLFCFEKLYSNLRKGYSKFLHSEQFCFKKIFFPFQHSTAYCCFVSHHKFYSHTIHWFTYHYLWWRSLLSAMHSGF